MNSNEEIYVVIETQDQAITAVTSNHDNVNIAIIERNQLDEKSENYFADVMDAPAMLTTAFKADVAEHDLHRVWLSLHDEELSMEDE